MRVILSKFASTTRSWLQKLIPVSYFGLVHSGLGTGLLLSINDLALIINLHYQSTTTGRKPRTIKYTVCPTRYRTRNFFNNSNTNEDIATNFEQEYVRCVRNEKECVCSAHGAAVRQPAGFGSEWDTPVLYMLQSNREFIAFSKKSARFH